MILSRFGKTDNLGKLDNIDDALEPLTYLSQHTSDKAKLPDLQNLDEHDQDAPRSRKRCKYLN